MNIIFQSEKDLQFHFLLQSLWSLHIQLHHQFIHYCSNNQFFLYSFLKNIMPYMNKAIVMWHLTSKPETRDAGNTVVANICIATTEKWKDNAWITQEKTTFHNCTLWWQSAKFAAEYANKGDLVLLEWKINNDQWEDENWNKRTSTKIIAQTFNILRSKLWGNQENQVDDGDDSLPF